MSTFNQSMHDRAVNCLMSMSYRRLFQTQNTTPHDSDGNLTEYSSDDDETPITRLTKRHYQDDHSTLYALLAMGSGFNSILDRIQNSDTPNWNPKLNQINKDELIQKLRVNQINNNDQDEQQLKLLHRLGLRFGDLAGYFPKVEINDDDEEDSPDPPKKTQTQLQIETDQTQARLHQFQLDLTETIPWFCGEDDDSVKQKRRKVKKIQEWIYQNVDIDGNVGDDLWDGLYRLNVVKVNYGNYLYYSLRCNQLVTEDDHNHPFYTILTTKSAYSDILTNPEIGGIVNDNEISRYLLKWLATPNSEIRSIIGHNFVAYHRQAIIQHLQSIHD